MAERKRDLVVQFLEGNPESLPVGSPIARVVLGLVRDALGGCTRSRSKLLDTYLAADDHDRVDLPAVGVGDLADRARAVLEGLAQGRIGTGAAKDLIGSLAASAAVGREAELVHRVELLERSRDERLLPVSHEDLA